MQDRQPPAIDFRDATLEDADLLLEWRNDPLTRRMSRSGDPVAPHQHLEWLSGVLADDRRRLCIAVEEGRPVGTMRLDRAPDGVGELSWTIAPEARGRGLGLQMVRRFCELTGGRLRAVVRLDNAASQKIALGAGLERCEDGADGFACYEGVFGDHFGNQRDPA